MSGRIGYTPNVRLLFFRLIQNKFSFTPWYILVFSLIVFFSRSHGNMHFVVQLINYWINSLNVFVSLNNTHITIRLNDYEVPQGSKLGPFNFINMSQPIIFSLTVDLLYKLKHVLHKMLLSNYITDLFILIYFSNWWRGFPGF